MKPAKKFAVLAAAALSLATAAYSAEKAYAGYLTPGEFDVTTVILAAPQKGDARYESDRAIFKGTRHMQGTARWQLATTDADYSAPALMRDFRCAVGVALTPENAPKVLRVIGRAGVDTSSQTRIAKDFYKRLRPYRIDQGDICQPKQELGNSFDYPSGHTTWGWTWAFILADLAPDRALPILKRGRAYGESRFVCGAHNESAVEAGMASASATLALVRTKPAFRSDLEDARAELAALRADPSAAKPQGCDAEAALIDRPVVIPSAKARR